MEAYTVRKRFPEWIRVKSKLHEIGRTPHIKEGEIWWCAVGENIGVEINGKNKVFSRPVLVLRKYNKYSFLAVPLTSRSHQDNWHAAFEFKGKEQFACLTQVRGMSASRLYDKMGEVSSESLAIVARGFHDLHFPQKYSLVLRLGWCGYPRKSTPIIAHIIAKVKALFGKKS